MVKKRQPVDKDAVAKIARDDEQSADSALSRDSDRRDGKLFLRNLKHLAPYPLEIINLIQDLDLFLRSNANLRSPLDIAGESKRLELSAGRVYAINELAAAIANEILLFHSLVISGSTPDALIDAGREYSIHVDKITKYALSVNYNGNNISSMYNWALAYAANFGNLHSPITSFFYHDFRKRITRVSTDIELSSFGSATAPSDAKALPVDAIVEAVRKLARPKPLYPGRRSGIDPMEFLEEHYGWEMARGFGPGQLQARDPVLFYAAKDRLLTPPIGVKIGDYFEAKRDSMLPNLADSRALLMGELLELSPAHFAKFLKGDVAVEQKEKARRRI